MRTIKVCKLEGCNNEVIRNSNKAVYCSRKCCSHDQVLKWRKQGSEAEYANRRRRTMIKPFLCKVYSGMKTRIETNKYYIGKELMSREDFYDFAISNDVFQRLFKQWKSAGNPHRLTPSPDRIDNSLGYIPSNIMWTTTYENITRCNQRELTK